MPTTTTTTATSAMSPMSTQSHSPFSDIVVLEIANADAGLSPRASGVANNTNDDDNDAVPVPSHMPPLPVRLFKVKRCRCEEDMSTTPQPSKKVLSPHGETSIPKRARTYSFALQPVRFDTETGSWDVSSEQRVRISPSKHYVTSAYDGQSSSLAELLNSMNGGNQHRTDSTNVHRSENPSSDIASSSSNPVGVSFGSTCEQNKDTNTM